MDLAREIIQAFFKVAVPVGALSFGMAWWALSRGYVKETDRVEALNREIKAQVRDKKEKKKNREKHRTDPLHDKWLKFGGGFYGLVALYTYGLVEWREIAEFIRNFGGLAEFFRQLNPGIVIEILIEALFNFITAVTWPVYWMSEISSARIWLWLLVAYGGYWLGIRLAQQAAMAKGGAATARESETDNQA